MIPPGNINKLLLNLNHLISGLYIILIRFYKFSEKILKNIEIIHKMYICKTESYIHTH